MPFVLADAVDRALKHCRLAVGGVAGDEDGLISILDDDREMVGRVAGRRHGDDCAVGGETLRARKQPVRPSVENQRFRIEMLGPALRQIAAKPAGDPRGPRKFARTDQNFAYRKRLEPAVVIDVQMSQDDAPDVVRADADRAQLRPRFLIRFDVEAHGVAEVGMPARQAFGGGGRA